LLSNPSAACAALPEPIGPEPIEPEAIGTLPAPACPICRNPGRPVFRALTDLLFGAPGSWSVAECGSCRALWLDPMPRPADIHRAYARYYTHAGDDAVVGPVAAGTARTILRAVKDAYLATRWGYGTARPSPGRRWLGRLAYATPLRRAAADAMVMYLPWQAGGRLLDIGCGAGRQMALMGTLGWAVEGVDFDPQAVAAAQGRGLAVRLGSLEAQRYPDASFDAVILSHVIEHVHEPQLLLREIARILKPGGRLVVLTPNAGGLGRRLYGPAWRGLEPPRHLTVLSPEALRRLFVEAGFAAAAVETKVKIAFGIFVESERLRRLARHPETTGRLPLATRLKCRALQLVELAALAVWRDAGEEIVGVARKA
jgi:SAM-dependent methyltransferase